MIYIESEAEGTLQAPGDRLNSHTKHLVHFDSWSALPQTAFSVRTANKLQYRKRAIREIDTRINSFDL